MIPSVNQQQKSHINVGRFRLDRQRMHIIYLCINLRLNIYNAKQQSRHFIKSLSVVETVVNTACQAMRAVAIIHATLTLMQSAINRGTIGGTVAVTNDPDQSKWFDRQRYHIGSDCSHRSPLNARSLVKYVSAFWVLDSIERAR